VVALPVDDDVGDVEPVVDDLLVHATAARLSAATATSARDRDLVR